MNFACLTCDKEYSNDNTNIRRKGENRGQTNTMKRSRSKIQQVTKTVKTVRTVGVIHLDENSSGQGTRQFSANFWYITQTQQQRFKPKILCYYQPKCTKERLHFNNQRESNNQNARTIKTWIKI